MSEDTDESRKIELQVPATASAGASLEYVLVNHSTREVLTGLGFGLDVESAGGWEAVNRRMIFTAVGIIVEPGQARKFSAALPNDLVAGMYRLRKDFRWSG